MREEKYSQISRIENFKKRGERRERGEKKKKKRERNDVGRRRRREGRTVRGGSLRRDRGAPPPLARVEHAFCPSLEKSQTQRMHPPQSFRDLGGREEDEEGCGRRRRRRAIEDGTSHGEGTLSAGRRR